MLCFQAIFVQALGMLTFRDKVWPTIENYNTHYYSWYNNAHQYHTITIKTHSSESWGQEEAGLCDEPVSY